MNVYLFDQVDLDQEDPLDHLDHQVVLALLASLDHVVLWDPQDEQEEPVAKVGINNINHKLVLSFNYILCC